VLTLRLPTEHVAHGYCCAVPTFVPAVARAALISLCTVLGLAVTAPSAQALALNTHLVPGFQSGVSCISTTLCVVTGYNKAGVGDVVDIKNGVPVASFAVPGAKSVYSVSCPAGAGCVALGVTTNDVSPVFVRVSVSGAVAATRTVTVPPGVSLPRISCVSLGSCEVAGTDIFTSPVELEMGHWDGTTLTLEHVPVPRGSSASAIEALSCSGTSCLAVGSGFARSNSLGLLLQTSGGAPSVRTVANASIYGVSCTTSSLCYGAGFTRVGGLVMTITDGAPSSVVPVKTGDLMAVACRAASCFAVGEKLAPPGAQTKANFYGVLVGLSNGRVGTSEQVASSGGFINVAQYGGAYAAIGASQGKGSEVTTFG
jgi:hypothetical protein